VAPEHLLPCIVGILLTLGVWRKFVLGGEDVLELFVAFAG
jgi:hypothetical protein